MELTGNFIYAGRELRTPKDTNKEPYTIILLIQGTKTVNLTARAELLPQIDKLQPYNPVHAVVSYASYEGRGYLQLRQIKAV